MICPIDQTELVISERQGVEIDYCPKCRGVWLDRGELDKVIDRSEQSSPPVESGYRERNDVDDTRRYGTQKKKKKESFLSELFDFG